MGISQDFILDFIGEHEPEPVKSSVPNIHDSSIPSWLISFVNRKVGVEPQGKHHHKSKTGVSVPHTDVLQKIYSKKVLLSLQTRSQAPWTEADKEWEDGWSNAFVDAYTSLDDFELWLNRTKTALPNFDHAALVTRYKHSTFSEK